MTLRRSKRKAVVLDQLGGRRRSSRGLDKVARHDETYNHDCGILPSD